MKSLKIRTRKPRSGKRRALVWAFGVLFVLAIAMLIHYRGVSAIQFVECGEPVSAADYTSRDAVLETGSDKLACGWHVLNLSIGGVPTPVLAIVRDTTAPTAEAVDRIVAIGSKPGPDEFVKNVGDAGVVRVSFAQQPDFDTEWTDTIEIVLEDQGNNRTVVPVRVSVRATVEALTVEAGEDIPDADRFLIEGVAAIQDTPINAEMLHHVGTYPVAFTTEAGIRSESMLIVVDTQTPYAEPTLLVLASNETAEAEDFVINAADETDLSFAFLSAPDYENREVQTIAVRLTDEGGNTTDVESKLLISDVKPRTVEARREALTPEDFENSDGQTIVAEPFVPDTPGTYAVSITVNGVAETPTITVVDTTPPELFEKPEIGALKFYTRHAYLPEDFFTAEDMTPVTLSFESEPDFDTAGDCAVTVIARDASGNESTATVTIKLRDDVNPPHLYGVINRICYVGEPITYFAEVFAEDDEDGFVEVTVKSEVTLSEKGTYRVIYRAEDKSGNATEQACNFMLIQRTVTEEELHALAQSIMAEITTPDMVDAEKLRAIFDYVQKQIVYANGSNNNYTDWRKAAYDGYTLGTGDCFNIYSLTRALLDETDIPYLSVERVKTSVWRTRHYWVMVDLGTGWYVFDPTRTRKHPVDCFMWTKQECRTVWLYWNYNEADYPPLATEPFDYDAVVEMERSGQLP
ncbi:MAG: transglutaminase domain-containing protein [Clostridia bacterium]|nr:transglutaminase domain-containing protein [Clostridia bacterium]